MKNSKEKIPDRLVDFCKHLSVNLMAATSRLPSLVMEFFSFLLTFQTHLTIFVLEQAVGPGVLTIHTTR